MGSLARGAVLFTSLLAALSGFTSTQDQDLRERDALCNADGCFVVYFQRKTFLDSWRACKENGGNLATIKRTQEAASIATLFSGMDLRNSRSKVQVWIGLQRQPRQCAANRPLRGFSWTTGDQDTEYTNWQKEDSPHLCLMPRCVVMSYGIHEQGDNFKWLDGSCSVPVDGYLCHYAYKEMCSTLRSEGVGNALYTTPFNLLSTLLTHVPFGSVATVPCPGGSREEQSVLCTQREDGSVGWSRDAPLCSETSFSHNWCDENNGECEHFCRPAGGHFYCECAEGYQLGDDGQSCELSDVCQGAPCEFECLPLADSYRCACPDGYMLAPDERGCLDVDECLQSPCEHICVNTLGTFQCRCREGFHPDEEGTCEDIDECMNDSCEHACENTLGSHICHCNLGYSPVPEDLSRCQDIDECQIAGICDQMCVNYVGGFECDCEEGFELMLDNFSCEKTEGGDVQPAVTPSFPWVSHQPGPVWVPADYGWSPEQTHTGWPAEEEQSLDWLTDPPTVLNSDVIWVTSAPQEELPFDLGLDPLITLAGKEGKDMDGADWPDWGQKFQSELNDFQTTPDPTPLITIPPSTPTPDWYEDEEETTTAEPSISTTVTISEGAWNWWVELPTIAQGLGNPTESATGQSMSTDSSDYREADEDQHLLGEQPGFSEEELEVKDGVFEEVTHSEAPTVPTEPTVSQLPPSEGGENVDIVDSVQEDRGQKQSSTWLLVGLLVPICIFLVVMVALGIVYCTRCAVQPRNKNATDCYHWISGAHDKQVTTNPSAGVKSHV